jgi:hypothetical protein
MRGESPGVSSRPHTHTQDNSLGIGPSTTSTALRDCSTSRSVAHTREAEPESTERQFVRWAYGDDCTLPYLPASQEPKRRTKDYEQPPINRVLAALLSVGCDYRPAKSVDEWEAHCPTHQDTHPSLVVRRNGDGSVWLKDWSGQCSKETILDALGLEWRDLWDAAEHDPGRRHATRQRPLLAPHLRRAMEELLKLDDERRAA